MVSTVRSPLEGRCIHYSVGVAGGRWSVDHSSDTYVDGTPDSTDPLLLRAHGLADGLSIDEAEAFARTILAAVEEARS